MKDTKKSFKFALSGLKYLFSSQKNFRIHMICAGLAAAFAVLLRFTLSEYALVAVLIGVVLSAEAVNTAIERTVDCASEEISECARQAKDSAAAAVFILALTALLVAALLYATKIIAFFRR